MRRLEIPGFRNYFIYEGHTTIFSKRKDVGGKPLQTRTLKNFEEVIRVLNDDGEMVSVLVGHLIAAATIAAPPPEPQPTIEDVRAAMRVLHRYVNNLKDA